MQCIIPFCLLCIVVLQQTINGTSIVSSQQKRDNGIRRLSTGRRLRAPLMGRSTTTILNKDIDFIQHEPNGSDENELIRLDKRYYSRPLLGRRRWMGLKRRGPLFG